MSANVGDIIKKYKPVPKQETSFFPTQSEINSPSVLSFSETDISGITEEGFNREQAFNILNKLKERVMQLLVNYQRELMKTNNDFRQLKNQLHTDAQVINTDYGSVVQELKKNGIIPGQEARVVMNIIEEFITKFSSLKEKDIKKFTDTPTPVQPTKITPSIAPQQLETELSNFLQISNISHLNFSLQEDTFYRATSVPQIMQRLQAKIERLKVRLEKILSREQLVNTRKILKDSIDDLNLILSKNDLKDIKRIVYKMEQTVQKISDTSFQSTDTVNLYKLIQKQAIRFTKKKEKLSSCLSIVEDRQESQVSQTSTSSQYTIPQNAFLKSPLMPKENLPASANNQQPNPLMKSDFSQPFPANRTITPSFPQQAKPQEIQTQFLHLCLRMKASLPIEHPGRKILIFSLFDRVQEEGISQENWCQWVTLKLNE